MSKPETIEVRSEDARDPDSVGELAARGGRRNSGHLRLNLDRKSSTSFHRLEGPDRESCRQRQSTPPR
jgi:hypothetical protein